MTLYVLGLAVGPLLASPLSESLGRLPVYHASGAAFVALSAGCALARHPSHLLALRFLAGAAGAAPLALGGATIADVAPPRERASAMSLFSLGPLTGPVLGPLVGGFVAERLGWRWTFWVLAAAGGAAGLAAAAAMRETNPAVLLGRRAARRRREEAGGDARFRSRLAMGVARPSMTPRRALAQALGRPALLLVRSPVLLVMSLYVALVFGLLYLLFTTFKGVFEGQYGFTTSTAGLVYLGLGVAMVLAMVVSGILNNRVKKPDGTDKLPPEQRLVPMIWFSPAVAVGLFIYGWTAYYQVHWIAPIIGTVFIGYGAFFVMVSRCSPPRANLGLGLTKGQMPAQLYLVDLFGSEAAASALGANILLRYVSGTFLPLAGPSMYRTLNYGWGNTLLGFLALAFVPAPILFYKYGGRLRAKSAVKLW